MGNGREEIRTERGRRLPLPRGIADHVPGSVSGLAKGAGCGRSPVGASPSRAFAQWLRIRADRADVPALAYRCGGSTGIACRFMKPSVPARLRADSPVSRFTPAAEAARSTAKRMPQRLLRHANYTPHKRPPIRPAAGSSAARGGEDNRRVRRAHQFSRRRAVPAAHPAALCCSGSGASQPLSSVDALTIGPTIGPAVRSSLLDRPAASPL